MTGETDTDKVYIKGMGVRDDELTEAEAFVIRRSEDYVNARDRKRAEEKIKRAREDIKRLSEIEGLPVEARDIIEKWIGEEE